MHTISLCLYVRNQEIQIKKFLNFFLSIDPSNIELIIIDDGSTDETLVHIQSFSLVYQGKVKLLMTPSVGEVNARNKAINLMHGEFISFLNVFDEINIEYINKLPKILDPNIKAYAIYPSLKVESMIPAYLMLYYYPHLSLYIFHRDIVKQVNLDNGLYQDYYQLINLLKSVDEVLCLPRAYLKTNHVKIEVSQRSLQFFIDVLKEPSDHQLKIFLMVTYILLNGIKQKVDTSELYLLQKEIKMLDSKYLKNPYLKSIDQKEYKKLKYLKNHLLFLIKD